MGPSLGCPSNARPSGRTMEVSMRGEFRGAGGRPRFVQRGNALAPGRSRPDRVSIVVGILGIVATVVVAAWFDRGSESRPGAVFLLDQYGGPSTKVLLLLPDGTGVIPDGNGVANIPRVMSGRIISVRDAMTGSEVQKFVFDADQVDALRIVIPVQTASGG